VEELSAAVKTFIAGLEKISQSSSSTPASTSSSSQSSSSSLSLPPSTTYNLRKSTGGGKAPKRPLATLESRRSAPFAGGILVRKLKQQHNRVKARQGAPTIGIV